jgi:antitoxin MazE
MNVHVGKWGNSLAVRLPRNIVEKFGIKEGDPIGDASIEAMMEVEKAEAMQARRDAAMEEISKRAFDLPPDWKFEREEANWRPAMDKW